jgi:hypothetical protein
MRLSLVLALFICLGSVLVAEAEPTTPAWTAGAEAARAGNAVSSGLEGTTRSLVISGVRDGQTTGGSASIEFAIAPLEGGKPAYDKAILVRSDREGKYRVTLPPGSYWIGPKAKALDPARYRPRAVVFQEQEAVVTEGAFSRLDLSEVGYAP